MLRVSRLPRLAHRLPHASPPAATSSTTSSATSSATSPATHSTSSPTTPAATAVPSARGRVPPAIWKKTAARLHQRPGHPLHTLCAHIEAHFSAAHPGVFAAHTDLPPVVTTAACFDDLLVPQAHVSRAASDTYYVCDDTLLRPHMTAHTPALLRAGARAFLACGDVYRRDTVDRTHYPVFHQLDAARLFPPGTSCAAVETDLKATLEGLARTLFVDADTRWVPSTFPFTEPSFELEVQWRGEWLELLGCGLLHRGVLRCAGVPDTESGWAFGLGLERVAMVLFEVPDIRLFWSTDSRFTAQFSGRGVDARFSPWSAFPPVSKDLALWVDDETAFCENDMHELVRDVCADLVEDVRVVDVFQRNGRRSLCFRLTFRSMERSLTHREVNALHAQLRERAARTLPVTLR